MSANTNTPAVKVATPSIVFFLDAEGSILFSKEYKTEPTAKGMLTKMRKPTYKNEAIKDWVEASYIPTSSLHNGDAIKLLKPETVAELLSIYPTA
jgi:hypothetical protein